MSARSVRCAHDLIIARRSADTLEVLLTRAADGWRLPRVESEERRAADVADLNRAARENLGLDISVLRCLRDAPADPTGIRWQVSAAECHAAPGPAPAGNAWFGAPTPDAVSLAAPAQHELLRAWLAEQNPGSASLDRQDWTRPGWRDRVTAWAASELRRRHAATCIVEIEQLRVWEFSSVLRLATDAGDFFLKALPPSPAAEPLLTRRLADTHPRLTPPVIAVEPERGWLLTRAVQGASLMEARDVGDWMRAADACARIQTDWAGRTAELEALGCPRRSLAWLEAEIDPLVNDEAALRVGLPDGLGEGEMVELRRGAPALRSACRELAGYGLPITIEHGDLWAENVIVAPEMSVLIDWEDAALAHPFFSPSLLLLSLEYTDALADAAGEARARIREVYLTPWRATSLVRNWPPTRLEAAFGLAQRLAMLYYAVQFRRFTLPRIETSWEVRSFTPFFARRLLHATRTERPDVS